MSTSNLSSIKQALEDAGIEIYRARPSEIEIAERVRLHIMDSGVRVVLSEASDELRVRFTARSQRSDFPNGRPEDLFQRVRESIGSSANDRGYEESAATVLQVTDPVNDSRVLDVWHEVTYEKSAAPAALVEEVRWALSIEKYVCV